MWTLRTLVRMLRASVRMFRASARCTRPTRRRPSVAHERRARATGHGEQWGGEKEQTRAPRSKPDEHPKGFVKGRGGA
eukprot:2817260-Pyramimonas_sp.AAC.1